MNQNVNTVIVVVLLAAFVIFRRIRRNIGWQPLNPRRLRVRLSIFIILGLIFFIIGAVKPITLISDIIGIFIGAVLAYYSKVLTQFEQREGHWYFRPNTWIGSLVTAIFLGRLVYRFYRLYTLGNLETVQTGGQAGSYQSMGYALGNNWAAGLLLIMFAYYVIYYILVLRNHKQNHLVGPGKETDL